MKRATIYARVSTKSNGQNPETQLVALRDRFRTEDGIDDGIRRSWHLRQQRQPAAARQADEGREGQKTNVVIVARFDRFARSTRHLILALEEFQSLGLNFISLNEH
ncbi:MAG TPA: recombinase family protein [Terriglobia bacterium]|nr:recombinase family protein [Terriglobia bacterium]